MEGIKYRTPSGVEIRVYGADGLTTCEWYEILGIGVRDMEKTISFKIMHRDEGYPSVCCVWQGRVSDEDRIVAVREYTKWE
jgi:hypothetical protein